MNYNIVIAESAEDDLRNIINYIAKELLAPGCALSLLEKINAAVQELNQLPLRHSLVVDGRLATLGIRKLHMDSYFVFYTVSEKDKTVIVVRILHSQRNWATLL